MLPWKRCQSNGELGHTSRIWYTHVQPVVYWHFKCMGLTCNTHCICGCQSYAYISFCCELKYVPCLVSNLWLNFCRIILHMVIGHQQWRVDIRQDWDLPELMAGELSRRCTHLGEVTMSRCNLNLLLIKVMSTLYHPPIGGDTIAWQVWFYRPRERLILVLLARGLWEQASPKGVGNKELFLLLLNSPALYLQYQHFRGQILYLVRSLIGMSDFD